MQKLKSSLNESLNQRLQAKYPHLELAVLPLSEVNKDNESKRIDSEYFKKEYLENEKIVNSQIRICDFVESKITNIRSLKLNKDFDYLQISDIDTNNGLEYTTTQIDFMHIPDRATYVLQNNDICVSTVRPNRNAIALIKDSKRLVGTSGFCVLRAKNKEVLPEVLYIFCKTKFFITKMMRANTASLYPAVIDSDILKCQIPQFSQDFQLEIERLVKDSHKALEDSKTLYKEAQNLLYESLGLDFINPLESLMRDTLAISCHTEALAEVSKNDSVDLVDSKDTHAKAPSADGGGTKELHSAREGEKDSCHDLKSPLPQHEGHLGVGSTCGDNVYCHLKCSEVSKSKGVDFVDTSAFSKPQYDKVLKSRNDENSPLFVGGQSSSTYLTRGDSEFSPSLSTSGVRGWVNTRNDDIVAKYPHLNISIRQLSQSYGKSGRLDSEYYQSKYDAIERTIKDYKGGWDYVKAFFSHNDTTCDFSKGKYNYIEIGDINTSNGTASYNQIQTDKLPANAKIAIVKNDILISKVRPYRGAVAIIDFDTQDTIASGAFVVLRENSDFKKEVLQVLLRTVIYKEWLLKWNVGTSYPVIKDEDILNLPIPKIDSTTQEQIASKIQKSFALRKVAKDLLESAKSKVEHAIEQGAR